MAYESVVGFPELARMSKLIQKKKADVLAGYEELAKNTVEVMKMYIVPKRRGSTQNLANAIDSLVTEDKDGVYAGVGNVEKLFAQAPYWYVVNYGSKWPGSLDAVQDGVTGEPFIPPANLGFFSDGKINSNKAGTGQAQWGHTGIKGNELLVPKNFTPINYIEKTQAWLLLYWGDYWKEKLNTK